MMVNAMILDWPGGELYQLIDAETINFFGVNDMNLITEYVCSSIRQSLFWHGGLIWGFILLLELWGRPLFMYSTPFVDGEICLLHWIGSCHFLEELKFLLMEKLVIEVLKVVFYSIFFLPAYPYWWLQSENKLISFKIFCPDGDYGLRLCLSCNFLGL